MPARGIKFVRIAPYVSGSDEPGDKALGQVAQVFLAVMDDPASYPVLVHCTAGRDRTGSMCAVYRMEFDHWSPDTALKEMQSFKFDPEANDAARAYADFVRSYRLRGDRDH